MSRLPILIRLTAAFAAAMMLMLAAAALFVSLRLRADLDDRVDANLNARAEAAAAAIRDGTDLGSVAVEDPEESFAQVLTRDGGVREAVGTAEGPVLDSGETRSALDKDLVVERDVPGIDGPARILAVNYDDGGEPVVIAIGQSLIDRNDALSSVVGSFLVGGVAALVAASMAGYALARSGLAPVEAMRARASRISAADDSADLPLPKADDEIRRLGQTLNEMLRRLRESYERERRFLDDASHELRTPLAVIQTDLDGALLTGGHTPEVEAALTSALDETHRLIRVAEDLLVLARTGDGTLPLHRQALAVVEMLDWARERFDKAAIAAHRSIHIDAEPDLVVNADQDRLRQVMTNLVDNALRHGSGRIDLVARTEADSVIVEVRDEGDGFPDWFASRAFERLSRADPSDRSAGVGIGLSIVETIAHAHGGSATTTTGRPSVVTLRFPVAVHA